MTPNPITPRDAEVACIMLDTAVGGRRIPREKFRKVAPPIDVTARRIAARLSEAAGQAITGGEVRRAHLALTSQVPTYELRAIAGAAR